MAKTDKYTRGPWRVEMDWEDESKPYVNQEDDHIPFMNINTNNPPYSGGEVAAIWVEDPKNIDVEFANAVLIAAAPDLLEACEDLLVLAEKAWIHAYNTRTSKREKAYKETVRKAKKAIIKARDIHNAD
jgi:hypothetical protein